MSREKGREMREGMREECARGVQYDANDWVEHEMRVGCQ